MNKTAIENLKEALKFSPNNIPLKRHLAESLVAFNELDEAAKYYQELIEISNESNDKYALANIAFQSKNFNKCIVIIDSLIDIDSANISYLHLKTKALVKENSLAQAIEMYQKIQTINPEFKDDNLDEKLKVGSLSLADNEEDFEAELNDQFIEKPDLTFEDVGGLENVKKEINLKIIHPLNHPEIYKQYGKKIGGGILLYGPPGCGKTFLAKATAGQIQAKFINVQLNDILDMWIGSSEKNLHEIFELARRNTPCVIFIDEIDALGASRSDMKQSSGRHLINQFLQELDGIASENEGVLIIGATNTPWHLDAAFRRPGRFDRIIFVPPPDEAARASIFELKLKSKPIDDVNYSGLAKYCNGYSGADIEAVIDIAVEAKLEEAIHSGIPKPITTKDLRKSLKIHKASTKEWFTSAKNYALYANETGLYDDILNYLNLKK